MTSKKSFSRRARDFARNYAHKMAQRKKEAAALQPKGNEGLAGPPAVPPNLTRGPDTKAASDSNATEEVKTEDSPDGTQLQASKGGTRG